MRVTGPQLLDRRRDPATGRRGAQAERLRREHPDARLGHADPCEQHAEGRGRVGGRRIDEPLLVAQAARRHRSCALRVVVGGDEEQPVAQQRLADDARRGRSGQRRAERPRRRAAPRAGRRISSVVAMPSVASTADARRANGLQQRRGDGVADVRRGDDPQQVGRPVGDAHHLLGGDRQVDHLRRQTDDSLAGWRQRQRGPDALDQRITEALTERRECLADRRFADAEGVGRGAERPEPHDQHEDLQLVERHGGERRDELSEPLSRR